MIGANKQFDFVGKRKLFIILSLVIMGFGLLFNLIFGVELDVSFKGGTLFKFGYQGELEQSTVEKFVDSKLNQSAEVEVVPSASGTNVINVYLTDEMTLQQMDTFKADMIKEYSANKLEGLITNSLSSSMSQLFFVKCLVAVALAALFLMIYVAFRFRRIGGWSAGAMALLALLHDMLIAYFTFVIFRIPLDDNFVAVLLSILGFSLNDTIVIYDRIRENRRTMDSKISIAEITNLSINQSFGRTFNTSLCTFAAIATVAVVALITGMESIISFALPMMFGIISGFYSTTFLCAPLWVCLAERKEHKKASKKKSSKKKA